MVGENSEVQPTLQPADHHAPEHKSPIELVPAATHTPLSSVTEQNFADMLRAQLAAQQQGPVPELSSGRTESVKASPKKKFGASMMQFIGSHKILAALFGILSFGIYSSARAAKEGQR